MAKSAGLQGQPGCPRDGSAGVGGNTRKENQGDVRWQGAAAVQLLGSKVSVTSSTSQNNPNHCCSQSLMPLDSLCLQHEICLPSSLPRGNGFSQELVCLSMRS